LAGGGCVTKMRLDLAIGEYVSTRGRVCRLTRDGWCGLTIAADASPTARDKAD
jgi:hypothetical protein